MFWCIAPFLLATIVLLPLVARPPHTSGWIVLGTVVLLCVCVLFGLWNAERFWWCWRAVGGIIAGGYLAYLINMIAAGEWFGDGRRSSTNAFNALMGLMVFGYPGFMYAVFGRFTLKPESEFDADTDEFDEFDEFDELDSEADR